MTNNTQRYKVGARLRPCSECVYLRYPTAEPPCRDCYDTVDKPNWTPQTTPELYTSNETSLLRCGACGACSEPDAPESEQHTHDCPHAKPQGGYTAVGPEAVGVMDEAVYGFNQLAPVQPGDWLNALSSAERKEAAMARGLLAYFPDALALIARHSVRMNEKHNPGQPVHWSRDKSTDHEDCITRHSASVAIDPASKDGDGAYHIACRAWRALAALQLWIEQKHAKGEKID